MVGRKWTDSDLNGYLDEINYLLSLEHPPQVLSTSYGYAESSMTFALTECVVPRSSLVAADRPPLPLQQTMQGVRSARRAWRLYSLRVGRQRRGLRVQLERLRAHLPLQLPVRDLGRRHRRGGA